MDSSFNNLRRLSTVGKRLPLRKGFPQGEEFINPSVFSRKFKMNKVLATLIAGLFAVGAFAQAPATPAKAAAPAAVAAPAAAPAKTEAAPDAKAEAAKMKREKAAARKAQRAEKKAAAAKANEEKAAAKKAKMDAKPVAKK